MKLRLAVHLFLWVLVAARLLTNGVQYAAYRKVNTKLDEIAEFYALRAMGNLREVRNELNAIAVPVTSEANAPSNTLQKNYSGSTLPLKLCSMCIPPMLLWRRDSLRVLRQPEMP